MNAIRLSFITFLLFLSGQSLTPKVACNVADEHYVNGLLHKYHLETPDSPFSYQFKTEVYNAFLGQSMQLPTATENLALEVNAQLNNSFFFKDISLLRNPNSAHKIRAYQLQNRRNDASHGKIIEAQTTDGHTIHATLLNRHSDTLIVLGAGFTQHREQMAPFGDIFSDSDVLSFDYRGHGIESSHPLRPQTWKSLSERFFGINRKRVTLGHDEEKDVYAIVSKARSLKKYRQVIGLGICYSGLIFAKTASMYPKLFDKLILNGTWFSLQHAAEIIARDPGLMARPQVHSHLADNWLVNQRWFQRCVLGFAQRFLNVDFNTVSVLDYAPKLPEDLEILFIHSKNDVLIPREMFEILWHATPCHHKTAIITSNEHVWDHLKEKELYKEICELFINLPYEQFSHLLVTPEALLDRKTALLQSKLK